MQPPECKPETSNECEKLKNNHMRIATNKEQI
jgi:hypothetical protein